MNAVYEEDVRRDRLQAEAAYRRDHGVSRGEWDLAEAMTEDLIGELVREFWAEAN